MCVKIHNVNDAKSKIKYTLYVRIELCCLIYRYVSCASAFLLHVYRCVLRDFWNCALVLWHWNIMTGFSAGSFTSRFIFASSVFGFCLCLSLSIYTPNASVASCVTPYKCDCDHDDDDSNNDDDDLMFKTNVTLSISISIYSFKKTLTDCNDTHKDNKIS